jgi:SAM-dependent methyltransferase
MEQQLSPEPDGTTEILVRREFRLFAGLPREPRILLVSTARTFRRLVAREVRPDDAVLEIGCSTGETTRLLAAQAKTVLAVDISDELVAKTAELFKDSPNVTVKKVDARNMPTLAQLMPAPDVVFIDVGGAALLSNAGFVMRQCLVAFKPRVMVVRNTELAAVASLLESVEVPLPEDWPFTPLPTGDESAMRLENLLAVSRAEQTESRVFAIRRLRLYDDPRARQRIQDLAKDSQPRVRRIAQATLDDLSRQHPR